MRCYLCGRRLARAAATLQTAAGICHAGPTCARKAGLLAPKVTKRRRFTGRPRKLRPTSQLELLA